ncbi:response regulator [Brevundimonas goettingensis]|uniref:Response regulator n=2 Tax=Brevundimonas goettingensis TaxID=2774190 RepID=A0A975GWM7_9CAUL|nr:response regulator [Brevundimonas goettingensis]
MTTPQAPFNVLIVEDEALLAMDLEAMIEDCGHRVVADAMSLADVHALAGMAAPDIAFVDLHLADGSNGLDVCAWIRANWDGTAIVFVTANPDEIPSDFGGAHGVIPKPFSRHGLASAMRFIGEGISDPPPKSGQPASFIASPRIRELWAA